MTNKFEEAIKDFALKHQKEMEKVIISELKEKFLDTTDGIIKWNCEVRLRLQERKDWEDKVREAIEKLVGGNVELNNVRCCLLKELNLKDVKNKLLQKNGFIKGVVTHDGKLMCSKCKRIFKTSEDVYTDGTRIDYDLCERCYTKEIKE